jgi:hypothetical protein
MVVVVDVCARVFIILQETVPYTHIHTRTRITVFQVKQQAPTRANNKKRWDIRE